MIFSKIKKVVEAVRMIHQNNLYAKEILKAHIFQSTISSSVWLKDKSFSPGGWAIDYGMLYTLYRILNDVKPKNVLEFGLGQSAKMIHQYSNYHSDSYAETIEHDEKWISFFKQGLNIEYDINIKVCPLKTSVYKGYETLGYDKIVEHVGDRQFNLIVVDGPFGSDHYSRYQIIELIPRCLHSSFCIVLDDYNRVGEKETFNEVCRILSENNIGYLTKVYSYLKEHAIICSLDWNLLTSM